MADDAQALADRYNELMEEVRRRLPEIMEAGGSQQKAREDARRLRETLEPIFREQEEVSAKLRALMARNES